MAICMGLQDTESLPEYARGRAAFMSVAVFGIYQVTHHTYPTNRLCNLQTKE